MSKYYITNADGEPIGINDLVEWGQWMQEEQQRVALDFVGSVRISTVFLGLDHNHWGGPPI